MWVRRVAFFSIIKFMNKLSLLAVFCFFSGVLCAAPVPRADELSLREQVGQTIVPRVFIGKHRGFKKAVQRGEVGGFILKTTDGLLTRPALTPLTQKQYFERQRKLLLKTISDLNKWAAKSPHQIPLILAFDYEGGTVTSPMYMGLKQMPSNMLLAASGRDDIVVDMYAAQAREIKAVGGNVSFGPATDVNSNPLNPIIQTRSFGDNAAAVGHNAAVAVRALQANGVAAFNKHFPGHGDTSVDSHREMPVTALPDDELWQKHVFAFVPSVDAGTYGIMDSHVVYPALDEDNPASFSAKILRNLLRGKMGFDGVVATDGLDMGAVNSVGVEDMVRRAYQAGNDMLLLSAPAEKMKDSYKYPCRAADFVEKNVFSGADDALTPEEIRTSAERILALKQKLGLFDGVTTDPSAETGFAAAARRAAEAGVTLVRDEQNLVPLPAEIKEVCAVMFADDIFSGQVTAFGEYLTARGKTSRTVILPVSPSSEDLKTAGECMLGAHLVAVGTSRGSAMNAAQLSVVQELFRAAEVSDKKAVLVSLLNPYEIPFYPQARTVLALYGPTEDSARTAAKILMGDLPAQGKLPVTLPDVSR